MGANSIIRNIIKLRRMTWGVPVARMEINGTLVGKPEGKSRL
jgi:hypothetical protein